jgi:hypothetical protein
MSQVHPQQHKQPTNTTTTLVMDQIHAAPGAGGLAHSFSKAAVEGFSSIQ